MTPVHVKDSDIPPTVPSSEVLASEGEPVDSTHDQIDTSVLNNGE